MKVPIVGSEQAEKQEDLKTSLNQVRKRSTCVFYCVDSVSPWVV